ncbi:unnamed protein product [Symbiodinium sp. CCMP2592]|nr:unnamed protein product [Symbiodinium sp. CCMP2592]
MIAAGDLNVYATTDEPFCGPGVFPGHGPHRDQGEFRDLLQNHRCTVLNSWQCRGVKSRTFLPPKATSTEQGTQVDYIIVKGTICDDIAKRAAPIEAPFVMESGCRHLPVRATVPMPKVPRPITEHKPHVNMMQVRKDLQSQQTSLMFREKVAHSMGTLDQDMSIDHVLLAGWELARQESGPRLHTTLHESDGSRAGVTLRNMVSGMWQLRAQLRDLHNQVTAQTDEPSLRQMWTAWKLTSRLQVVNRELRKQCRQRKTAKVADAVASDSIHQAVKRFAPKQQRRRLQLRSVDGHLQSHEAELQQIVQYFTKLYSAVPCEELALSADINISVEEVWQAMRRIKPAKAMPSACAPAALWKLVSADVVPVLAKLLGAIVATRLQSYALAYLRGIPQFAPGNSSLTIPTLCMLDAKDVGPQQFAVGALEDAQVPSELVRLHRGLRQGCGLAPVLWAIYSGWVLRALDREPAIDITDCNTTYADDFLYAWIIRSGKELENVYQAMKQILVGLCQKGLELSMSKTVAILKLHGPQAAACLRRYQVDNPHGEGQCLKFMIAGEPKYIKIVTQHIYLGVIVSFGKFEQQTFEHRLRLRLWQGTVLPTLLHGLDCTGLTAATASTLLAFFFKHARSVAKSHSQFTHETNMDFAKRLRLTNPIASLLQAIHREEQSQWRQLVHSQLSEVTIPTHQTEAPPEQAVQLCDAIVENELAPPAVRESATSSGNPMWLGTCSPPSLEDRHNKFHKPEHKGVGGKNQPKGKGKGQNKGPKPRKQGRAKASWSSWGRNSQGNQMTGQDEWNYEPEEDEELDNVELKNIVKILTALILRHESQHCLHRLDTGFVIFLKTDVPANVATSTFKLAKQWHAIKSETPEKLEAPMRTTLLQHLLVTVQERAMKMLETPSSRSTAVSLGWLSEDETQIMGANGGDEVPCYEAAERAVSGTHAHDAAGDRASRRVGSLGMAQISQTHPVCDLGGSRGLPSSRADPEESVSSKTGGAGQIFALKLGNKGNYCYSNAVVRSMLHLAECLGGLQVIFEGTMLEYLTGLKHAKGTIHMWNNPFWRAQMGKWRNPHMQHDVAEFLAHALHRLPHTMSKLATPWQARSQGTNWRVQDEGQSIPLTILPEELAGGRALSEQSVQSMITAWHNQEDVHALVFWPPALVFQAGRFDFDADGRKLQKRRYKIRPDHYIRAPGFDRDGTIHWKQYQLCSVIIHKGNSPDSGHYFNLLYDCWESSYHIADDGVVMVKRLDAQGSFYQTSRPNKVHGLFLTSLRTRTAGLEETSPTAYFSVFIPSSFELCLRMTQWQDLANHLVDLLVRFQSDYTPDGGGAHRPPARAFQQGSQRIRLLGSEFSALVDPMQAQGHNRPWPYRTTTPSAELYQ